MWSYKSLPVACSQFFNTGHIPLSKCWAIPQNTELLYIQSQFQYQVVNGSMAVAFSLSEEILELVK